MNRANKTMRCLRPLITVKLLDLGSATVRESPTTMDLRMIMKSLRIKTSRSLDLRLLSLETTRREDSSRLRRSSTKSRVINSNSSSLDATRVE